MYATSESFLSKVAFESDFRKKTFRCVIGLSLGQNIEHYWFTLLDNVLYKV